MLIQFFFFRATLLRLYNDTSELIDYSQDRQKQQQNYKKDDSSVPMAKDAKDDDDDDDDDDDTPIPTPTPIPAPAPAPANTLTASVVADGICTSDDTTNTAAAPTAAADADVPESETPFT